MASLTGGAQHAPAEGVGRAFLNLKMWCTVSGVVGQPGLEGQQGLHMFQHAQFQDVPSLPDSVARHSDSTLLLLVWTVLLLPL